jgi:ATP-dependent Lhr-like helicase
VRRENFAELPPPVSFAELNLEPQAQAVLDALRRQGASFVVDICQATDLPPGAVRAALWRLLRLGLTTNDRFDVIRRGEPSAEPTAGRGTLLRRGVGRRGLSVPEGRWSLLPWASPSVEAQAILVASMLLRCYGIAARDFVPPEAGMPPWRVLYEVLSRMEMAGEVRRGYFVEGLSGAQFALPEAAQRLQESVSPLLNAPAVLVHSLDPANLYGSGAPFDIPLLDGGTRPFLRRAGNWLVMCAGRPVLLMEQQGTRLTALASATADQLVAAVALLPELLRLDRSLAARHKVTVGTWNGQPIAGSPGQELLEQAGFVRDYQSMTLYAGWTSPARG